MVLKYENTKHMDTGKVDRCMDRANKKQFFRGKVCNSGFFIHLSYDKIRTVFIYDRVFTIQSQ